MRTGPLGRLARIVLAVVATESLISIVDQGGPTSFRGSRNLTEPSLLLLDALMAALFVSLAGVLGGSLAGERAAGRWSTGAAVALGVGVVVAAALSSVAYGTVWDRPLSDLVWWFDVGMLIETIAALVLAVALGVPGCEIGVWALLVARARGQSAPPAPVGCVVGLHLLDEWESARHSPGR